MRTSFLTLATNKMEVVTTIEKTDFDEVIRKIQSFRDNPQQMIGEFEFEKPFTTLVINWTNVISLKFDIVEEKRRIVFLYNTGLNHRIQEASKEEIEKMNA